MKAYLQLNNFYSNPAIVVIRILFISFLTALIVLQIFSHTLPKIPLGLFGLFIAWELFMEYKIGRVTPNTSVKNKTKSDIFDSFAKETATAFITHHTSSDVIKSLLKKWEIKFLLAKTGITPKEIPLINIPLDVLTAYSIEITRYVKGDFVTPVDVLVSYLFILEPHTKLLFAKELKQEDIAQILKLSRGEFPFIEYPKKPGIQYKGDGIGEGLVTGWTPNTMQFTKNITYKSLLHEPYIFGREEEFKELLEGLSKQQSNNVLIVGERGSGKDTLVESFAYKSYMGELQEQLSHKRVLELLTGLFVSGVSQKSDLETRLQEIINEVSHGGNVVLFIPDLSNLLGEGATDIDMSSILMPYLKDGSLAVVATATNGVYKKLLEDHPIMEVFDVVKLDGADQSQAVGMVFKKAGEIEAKEHVTVTYKAIKASVEYSHRFMTDAVLPGSAVYLLEDSAHKVSLYTKDTYGKKYRGTVTDLDIVKTIEAKTKISVAKPVGEEKYVLLHLEDKLHERIIDQAEAVTAISEAMRRIRTGLASTTKPISFLFLGPTGVGKTETAKALAHVYFHGEDHMIRLDMSEYSDETGLKRLLGAGPGEGSERGELTDKIHENPFSLVLLDEFEKANTRILDLFLQVLEDGRLTDNKGRTVSFVNAIVIATSNAGAEFIREEIKKGTKIDEVFHKRLLDELQSKNIFRPELLNRFDAVVTFKPLGKDEVGQITKLLLSSLIKKMQEKDITLSFDDSVLQKIVTEGTNDEFGARPLRRFVQDKIEGLLAQKMLTEEIKRGNRVTLNVDQDNNPHVIINT
ncbi:MAG: hypothetical protein A3F31_01025 [Candidatus Levybacteria bacterium RIFCSPHIGHO2_12_FULL_38_12]|nr:MAG: hypothetical protein A2770_01655 [Candidatus Levybacteria bacterium RIFCSPHIGHO2_01_FULL_38_12]OGH22002.1 MAG: hypothetical protein A3D75_03185 [Candidatus Levybacteria bacterium RIFCSPHIGHO2_02_FULL_37_18]OGH23073.1 MAG: hypothetical protein A3F31_01025 [Candidatus Levybacteria bacterium RIFCSPHIGHO2_12_FULL_38_12]OGH44601.1 MAG: hypothetical protein A3J14_00705 [Candidatus Levybacteria bacterium RIFCSPLOWO2_02_FULL_37_18]